MSTRASSGKRGCARWILGAFLGITPWISAIATHRAAPHLLSQEILYIVAVVTLVVASVSNFRKFGPVLVGALVVGPVVVLGYGGTLALVDKLSNYGLKVDQPPFR